MTGNAQRGYLMITLMATHEGHPTQFSLSAYLFRPLLPCYSVSHRASLHSMLSDSLLERHGQNGSLTDECEALYQKWVSLHLIKRHCFTNIIHALAALNVYQADPAQHGQIHTHSHNILSSLYSAQLKRDCLHSPLSIPTVYSSSLLLTWSIPIIIFGHKTCFLFVFMRRNVWLNEKYFHPSPCPRSINCLLQCVGGIRCPKHWTLLILSDSPCPLLCRQVFLKHSRLMNLFLPSSCLPNQDDTPAPLCASLTTSITAQSAEHVKNGI